MAQQVMCDDTVEQLRGALQSVIDEHLRADRPLEAICEEITDDISAAVRSISNGALAQLVMPFALPERALGQVNTFRKSKTTRVFHPKTIERFKGSASIDAAALIYIYIYLRVCNIPNLGLTKEEEDMASRGPLVSSVRSIFNCSRGISADDMTVFRGRYELLRHEPVKLDGRFLAGELLIGEGELGGRELGPFDCAIRYSRDDKPEAENFGNLTGQIVKLGGRAIMFLYGHRNARFLYYIDHKVRGEAPSDLAGIVVADASPTVLASAFPFHARLLNPKDPVSLGVIDSRNLAEEVGHYLGRGHVEWMERRFPGPLQPR